MLYRKDPVFDMSEIDNTENPGRTPEEGRKRPASSRPADGTRRPADGRKRTSSQHPERGTKKRPAAPNGGKRRKRRRKKKKSTLKTVLIVLLVILLALAAAGYAVFRHLYGQMNVVPKGTTPEPVEQTDSPSAEVTPDAFTPAPTDTPEPTPSPTPTEEELQAIAEQELLNELQQDAEEIIYNENVYNLLLIGADGTSDVIERGDAMILLSINKESKKIWLTSLMRDTQVYIPNIGYGHLNWTTSPQNYGGKGGVELLISTIESQRNFAVHIDNWALVNFLDFADVASLLGPIKVTVSADEAHSMNGLIRQVARMRDEKLGIGKDGIPGTPRSYFPKKGGTFEISDGIQILAYCRERYAGPMGEADVTRYGDTGRSNKQREVLMLMWENVKKMNLLQQYALAEKVMSIVTTDLTQGKCASLLLQAPSFLTYEIGQQQCPHPYGMSKGRDESGLSVYFPDWVRNRNYLLATIYAQPKTAAELTSSASGNRVLLCDPTA